MEFTPGEEGEGSSSSHSSRRSSSPGEAPARLDDDVEALRRAVEVQEAHVRLLRVRKTAREALLHRIQDLLATGDALESHSAIEGIVREAEASLRLLQRDDRELGDALVKGENSNESGLTSCATSEKSSATELHPDGEGVGPGGDEVAAAVTRIFHSGVEAQLAAVADPERRPTLRRRSTAKKKKLNAPPRAESSAARAALEGGGAPRLGAASPFPHSATMVALLSQATARQDAGRAAMLAALDSLALFLQRHVAEHEGSQATGGAVRTSASIAAEAAAQPPWLHVDEIASDVEPQRSVSQAYSDDFESSTGGDDEIPSTANGVEDGEGATTHP